MFFFRNLKNNFILILLVIVSLGFIFFLNSQYTTWDINHVLPREIYVEFAITTLLSFFLITSFTQYFIFKDGTYVLYTIYIISNLYYFASRFIVNHIDQLMLPKYINIGIEIFSLPTILISYYFYLLFCIGYLSIKKTSFLLYKKLKFISKFYLAFTLIFYILKVFANTEINNFVSLIILLSVTIIGVINIILILKYSTSKITKILIAGSILLFCGHVLGFLFTSNILPYPTNIFPFNTWIFYTQFGTLLEILLFSSSFAYRTKLIQEEQQQASQNLIVQLQENEVKEKRLKTLRDEIARDLHDEVGSGLTSINLLTKILEKKKDTNQTKSKQLIKKISEQSLTIQNEMSDIVWAIKTNNEGIENVAVRMNEYLGKIMENAHIDYELMVDDDVLHKNLKLEYRKDFLLIFKEALNNIVKHAQCTKVTVKLFSQNNTLILCIQDNGIGFNTEKPSTQNGLKNMKYRAEKIEGTLQITATKDTGTTLSLILNSPYSSSV